MKKLLPILALTLLTTHSAYAAGGSNASEASVDLSSQGLSEVVNGSVQVLAAGSEFTVASVQTVGQFVMIGLKSVGNSAIITIKLSSQFAGNVSIAAGQLITATAQGAGYLLKAGSEIIAFIPNEIGQSLIYSSQL